MCGLHARVPHMARGQVQATAQCRRPAYRAPRGTLRAGLEDGMSVSVQIFLMVVDLGLVIYAWRQLEKGRKP